MHNGSCLPCSELLSPAYPVPTACIWGGGCTRTEKPTPPVLSLPRPSSLSIRHTEGPEANQAAPTSGRVYQPGQRSGREGSAVMTPCLSSHPPVLGGPSLAPPLLGTGSKPLLLGLSLLSPVSSGHSGPSLFSCGQDADPWAPDHWHVARCSAPSDHATCAQREGVGRRVTQMWVSKISSPLTLP